jgi:hypothetical protein
MAKGHNGLTVWIIARRVGDGDIVVRNCTRSTEAQRQALIEDIGGPEQKLLLLAIMGRIVGVGCDSVVSQSLAELGCFGGEDPG